MVKWAFSRRRYSNASRCRVGGKPASAPAMSNPATSSSRNAMASSAISRDRAACRMAVSSSLARIRCPRRGRRVVPAATPSSTARTTSVSVRFRSVCSSGANRISA